MAYTAASTTHASRDELRARIPGWGADLDPNDRPSVPRLRFDPEGTGAHWDFPERQVEKWPHERSIEHAFLTPVFGTACPPKGVSGAMRRYAFRFGEARAAHWLILLAADRVDAWGSHVRSFASMRPDNPITETGIRSEWSHHGLRSRRRSGRADLPHQMLDPIVVAGPWVVAALAAYATLRKVLRRPRARRASAVTAAPRARWRRAERRAA